MYILLAIIAVIFFIIVSISISEKNIDIMSDYKEIQEAYKKYKKKNKALAKNINNLRPYLKEGSTVNLSRYEISLDDSFLLIKKIPSTIDPNQMAKKIGSPSVYKDGVLKLRLGEKQANKPVAVISISPIDNIDTLTKIKYSSKESIAEEGVIKKEEWENKKEFFDEEGLKTIKLRVMDKYNTWSDWVSTEIFVKREEGVRSIHASNNKLLIINNDGSVDTYDTKAPTEGIVKKEEIKRMKTASVEGEHVLFISSSSKVYSIGNNEYGQLGTGDRNYVDSLKITWGLENIVDICTQSEYSGCVNSEGEVFMWGRNTENCMGETDGKIVELPFKIKDLENVKRLKLGPDYVLALKYDGTVVGWGNNKYGQLAIGYKSKKMEITTTLLEDIKDMAVAKDYALFITNSGKLLGVGDNKKSLLGTSYEESVLFPVEIRELKDIKKVVCSNTFIIALDYMGYVYTWGKFDIKSNRYSMEPAKINELTDVVDIACTINKGFALCNNGDIYEFTNNYFGLRKLGYQNDED